MEENEISKIILDAAIMVHRALGGPGLLESVYQNALVYELKERGLKVEKEVFQQYSNVQLQQHFYQQFLYYNFPKVLIFQKEYMEQDLVFQYLITPYFQQ